MSEMHCAGVRRDLQSAMCAMSKMQCVPSSRKTYPCQHFGVSINVWRLEGTLWTLLVTFCIVIIRCRGTFWLPCITQIWAAKTCSVITFTESILFVISAVLKTEIMCLHSSFLLRGMSILPVWSVCELCVYKVTSYLEMFRDSWKFVQIIAERLPQVRLNYFLPARTSELFIDQISCISVKCCHLLTVVM
jgi:hypothetical protein